MFASNDRKINLKWHSLANTAVLIRCGAVTVVVGVRQHSIAGFSKTRSAQRLGARLSVANANECNNADERLSPCPMGATQMRHCYVTVLEKAL